MRTELLSTLIEEAEVKLEQSEAPAPSRDCILLQGVLTYLENAHSSFRGMKFADVFKAMNVEALRCMNPLILESGGTLIFHL